MKPGFTTRAIHTGCDPAEAEGALTPPVHLTSTYVFDTVEHGAEAFSGTCDGYTYGRTRIRHRQSWRSASRIWKAPSTLAVGSAWVQSRHSCGRCWPPLVMWYSTGFSTAQYLCVFHEGAETLFMRELTRLGARSA
jgi:hypothetical protein